MIQLRSKLPNLATTIFSQMSALAAEHNAINLSQGFPNFDCDSHLQNLCTQYINKGFNQYAPMAGVANLRQILSEKIFKLTGSLYDINDEITITSGATQALFTAIMAFIQQEDEVIIIEPAYDCYKPAIELCGGKTVAYALRAENNWKIDWTQFATLISPKTAMIIINTPHNPTGSIWEKSDFEALEKLVKDTNIIILSDEVYEHLVFDNAKHHSVLSFPGLRARSLATYSFGKTLHTTGWKLGYIVGDGKLMHEFRKIHQYNVFSANTPFQYAIADYLQDENTYLSLGKFFQEKRDTFLSVAKDVPLKWLPCQGTYFQVADYSALSDKNDVDFSVWLTKEIGVAVIPISVFYTAPISQQKLIRICFAKTNETLEAAAQRLTRLKA